MSRPTIFPFFAATFGLIAICIMLVPWLALIGHKLAIAIDSYSNWVWSFR